jgi:hypothetical protein
MSVVHGSTKAVKPSSENLKPPICCSSFALHEKGYVCAELKEISKPVVPDTELLLTFVAALLNDGTNSPDVT